MTVVQLTTLTCIVPSGVAWNEVVKATLIPNNWPLTSPGTWKTPETPKKRPVKLDKEEIGVFRVYQLRYVISI